MKRATVIKYILSFAFLLAIMTAKAQNGEPPAQDDEFNLFLLALASIFVCAMIGAAIIGALVASLIVITIIGLTTLGILSTSIAVGLYKRSVSSGFKTFLAIVFGLTGGVLGIAGSFLSSRLFELQVSGSTLLGIAGAGGAIGGVLMAFAAYKVVQASLLALVKRFRPA